MTFIAIEGRGRTETIPLWKFRYTLQIQYPRFPFPKVWGSTSIYHDDRCLRPVNWNILANSTFLSFPLISEHNYKNPSTASAANLLYSSFFLFSIRPTINTHKNMMFGIVWEFSSWCWAISDISNKNGNHLDLHWKTAARSQHTALRVLLHSTFDSDLSLQRWC